MKTGMFAPNTTGDGQTSHVDSVLQVKTITVNTKICNQIL